MKYELIKCYPGFTELGKIEDSENGYKTDWKGTIFYDAHPKFWKKVEEVDYEILTVYDDKISYKIILPYYQAVAYNKFFNKKRMWEIHSVKRLSDGEIFTIGDLIDFGDFGNKGFQPIDKIEVDYFDKTRITNWDGAYGRGAIKKWKKAPAKTPLFTTEDGVDIFKDDKYYFINNMFECVFCFAENLGMLKSAKTFSTRENAEEYIIENKPCLSFKEVKELAQKDRSFLFMNLKNLIKNHKL